MRAAQYLGWCASASDEGIRRFPVCGNRVRGALSNPARWRALSRVWRMCLVFDRGLFE